MKEIHVSSVSFCVRFKLNSVFCFYNTSVILFSLIHDETFPKLNKEVECVFGRV